MSPKISFLRTSGCFAQLRQMKMASTVSARLTIEADASDEASTVGNGFRLKQVGVSEFRCFSEERGHIF